MRAEVSDQEKKMEDLQEKEQEMEDTYEANMLALKEQIVKTMESNFRDQETKMANLSQGLTAFEKNITQGVAKNAANAKAFEAKMATEEEEQETKIANNSQGVATNAANVEVLEKKMTKQEQEQETKIAENAVMIATVSQGVAANMSSVQEWADTLIHNYTDTKIDEIENRVHAWHWHGETEISLHGASSGPDRGQVFYKGRPLCNVAGTNNDPGSWNIDAANVVCRMLGFVRATDAYKRKCQFGGCTSEDWILSGFNCTGNEMNISECPHETTIPSACDDANVDGVGVQCDMGVATQKGKFHLK